MNKNKYIFLTADIHVVGGMQSYVAGKTKYLSKHNYDVTVLYMGKTGGECRFSLLNEYTDGGIRELSFPPCMLPKIIVRRVIRRMLKIIGNTAIYEKIIVESQDDPTSQWGELLASKIQGKHYCFICNELFRGKDKHYEDKIDFYSFKLGRREIAGIKADSIQKLFDGYKVVSADESPCFVAAGLCTVQNVEDPRVSQIQPADYTITYVGRINKGYVPNIIRGIKIFSHKYSDKSVQVVFVGNVDGRKNMILSELGLNNISIQFMGDMVPMPQQLFDRTDVVIAGSGCALAASGAGALTLVADAAAYTCIGLLGYETANHLYFDENDNPRDFDVALEDVLVKHIQDSLTFHLPLPGWQDEKFADKSYQDHFGFIAQSDQRKTYYDSDELCRAVQRNYLALAKFYIRYFCPRLTRAYSQLKNKE